MQAVLLVALTVGQFSGQAREAQITSPDGTTVTAILGNDGAPPPRFTLPPSIGMPREGVRTADIVGYSTMKSLNAMYPNMVDPSTIVRPVGPPSSYPFALSAKAGKQAKKATPKKVARKATTSRSGTAPVPKRS